MSIQYQEFPTSREILNVRKYGADPTGTNDSSAAIQAAIDDASSQNFLCFAQGTFKLLQPIYITGNFDGSLSTFNCSGTNTNSIIIQANKTANTTATMSGKTVKLPVIDNLTKPGTGWAGQGTAVLCRNLDNCRISVPQITDFSVGLHVSAYSGGTAYSEFDLGRLVNNKTNLLVKPDNNAGWVNQNLFMNGRMGTFESGTLYFVELAPYGFGNSTDFNAPNTNTFVNLSVEGDGDGNGPLYHIQLAGISNTFINTRLEVSTGTPKINYVGDTVVANLTGRNLFVGGYSFGNIVWTSENITVTQNNVIGIGYESDRRSSANPWFMNGPGGDDIIRIFKSNKNMQTAAESDTDWTVKLTEDGLETKGTAWVQSGIAIEGQRIYIGDGSTAVRLKPYIMDSDIGCMFSSGLSIGGYVRLTEMATPGNAPANKAYLYLDDSGGKTRLMCMFPTGSAQQISIEPQ